MTKGSEIVEKPPLSIVVSYGVSGDIKDTLLKFTTVDSSNTDVLENKKAIYLFQNKNNEVIYIGETTKLRNRTLAHLNGEGISKKFYTEISYISYCYVEIGRYERLTVEGILVNQYKPLFNCEDELMTKNSGESLRGMSLDLVQDVIYYGRIKRLKHNPIAEALNVPVSTVISYSTGRIGGYIELPLNYTPKAIITGEQRTHYTKLTKDTFYSLYKEIQHNELSKEALAVKYDVSRKTVFNVQALRCKKYKKWLQEIEGHYTIIN